MKSSKPELYNELLEKPHSEYIKWKIAAVFIQKIKIKTRSLFLEVNATIKKLCSVRFHNKPETEQTFPSFKDQRKFIQIRGTVQSMSTKTYVELAKEFECQKCNKTIICHADYNNFYEIKELEYCPIGTCAGILLRLNNIPVQKHYHDYQELYLEELNALNKRLNYITVTVEDDLVDECSLGELIIVVGTVEVREKDCLPGEETDCTFVVKANSIVHKENHIESLNPEQKFEVEDNWFSLLNEKSEFGARDHLIDSFHPKIYGMFLPKLAVLLSIASCVEREDKRPHSHTLITGPPSVGKSQLLTKAIELAAKGFYGGGIYLN